MSKPTTIMLALGICLLTAHLAVAQYDGSVPLLCAPVTVLECAINGECQRGTADSVNVPRFITIDVKEQTIGAATDPSKTNRIKHVERINGRTILQGAQGTRAWSIVLDEEKGDMSLTVAEDEFGFVIFGVCTPR